MNGQELWGNSTSVKRSHSFPFLPTCLPLTQPGALPKDLSPGSRHCWLLTLLPYWGYHAHLQQSRTPLSPSTSMTSYCKAGVLLWQTLNSCLLQEKGSCIWVNRFKPKCSNPSLIARLFYNAKMSHRNSFFTLLCTSPWSNAVSPGAARVSLWQLQHCRTTWAQMVWFCLPA